MALYQRTVLVVEDEPLIRLHLADTLEDAGYTVLEASNVLEAVAVLGQSRTVDAVNTDIDMPGALDGFDLMKLICSCYRDTAVIVTSGGHVLCEAELQPGCAFIPKPYDLPKMLDMLAARIAQASTRSSQAWPCGRLWA